MSRNVSTEFWEEQKKFLSQAILHLNDGIESQNFLQDLLSETELKNAVKRWCATAKIITDDITHKQIASDLELNKNTVSRIDREIVRNGSGISQTILKRLNE